MFSKTMALKMKIYLILFGHLLISIMETTQKSIELEATDQRLRVSSFDSTDHVPASFSEENSGEEYTHSMLYRLALQKMDPNKNFIISPKQIAKLLQDLQRSQDANINANAKEEEADESNNVVEIQNEILSYGNKNNNESREQLEYYARKLINSRIKYSSHKLNYDDDDADTDVASLADLFNRVALHVPWAFNFFQRDSHKEPFYNSAQRSVYRDFMRKDDVFRFAELVDLNATAVELRLLDYARNRHTLLIILPNDLDGLAALEEQLADLEILKDIVANRLEDTLVRVLMPKFKFSHRLELHDFLNTTKIDSKLAKIHHETSIKVSEDGLGTFGPKTVFFWNAHFYLRIKPQIFNMNHPFFFVVHNNNGIQCLGHVARL